MIFNYKKLFIHWLLGGFHLLTFVIFLLLSVTVTIFISTSLTYIFILTAIVFGFVSIYWFQLHRRTYIRLTPNTLYVRKRPLGRLMEHNTDDIRQIDTDRYFIYVKMNASSIVKINKGFLRDEDELVLVEALTEKIRKASNEEG